MQHKNGTMQLPKKCCSSGLSRIFFKKCLDKRMNLVDEQQKPLLTELIVWNWNWTELDIGRVWTIAHFIVLTSDKYNETDVMQNYSSFTAQRKSLCSLLVEIKMTCFYFAVFYGFIFNSELPRRPARRRIRWAAKDCFKETII